MRYAIIAPLITVAMLTMTAIRGECKTMHDSAPPWLRALFTGKIADTWEDLKAYTGREAAERIIGERRREAYLYNYDQLGLNYGDNVDYQLRQEQVILCPQTVDFLYSRFTPLEVRYQPGSRPQLERVVGAATAGCETATEKALALMRFCCDLYTEGGWERRSMSEYIYGGTEEQLIEKGEQLCECLGRLYVALCEIAGIPGRIVMHDIGGHIASEVYVDGGWGYIDPRCGIYFRKPDGSLASVWELTINPALIWAQEDEVKADASPRWTWEFRAWKCQSRYFDPREVNGFQNYSLAEAGKYNYGQLSYQEVVDRGLFDTNAKYLDAIADVFNHDQAVLDSWSFSELRALPISFRHDGFSMFFREDEMDRAYLEEHFLDPLAGTDVEILEWGLGPGSVFCYDTKVGEVFGKPLTEEQWKLMRQGDRWVYEHVMSLIDQGADPLKVAVGRSHELGLKLFARLEMQHEYGPADPANWMWAGFVGSLNKEHPEYRIPGSVHLDFKHQEVRDFKLAVLREAAIAGADGLSLDFAVYPPYFEEPDADTMTQFMRECRRMANEVGEAQDRQVEIMVRIPRDPVALGLDWQQWVREGLIDYLVPATRGEGFDIPIEDYVAFCHQYDCAVFACLWHSMGLVDTDQQPGDEEAGIRRYDRPKTQEVFAAQAMLVQRMGADGIQVAMSSGDEMLGRPWLLTLGRPEELRYADKLYIVERPGMPVKLSLPDQAPFATEVSLDLRVGDNVPGAIGEGHAVEAELRLYSRPLSESETLEVYVNGRGPVVVPRQPENAGGEPIDWRHSDRSFITQPGWWRQGLHRFTVDPGWWRIGNNRIQLVYSADSLEETQDLRVMWLELYLDYAPED